MIRIDSINKSFSTGRRKVRVLEDISFQVDGGECIAIKGRSGSGKTTLLNCMAGIEKPDNGSVLYGDKNIASLSTNKLASFLRTNTGFVFQNNNLISYLTVFENIAFPLNLNGVFGAKASKKIAKFLEIIGMEDAKNALPTELSGGESLRVAVARALINKPRIVFADEPTASLDSATAKVIIKLLTKIGKDQNCAVVFSTHDNEILDKTDRVLELKDGRLI